MKRTLPFLTLFLLMTPLPLFAGETIVVESSDIAFDAVDKAELTEFTVTCSQEGCRIKSPMGTEAVQVLKDEVSRITGADVKLEDDKTESESCNSNKGSTTDRGSRGKTDREQKGSSATGTILKEGGVEIIQDLLHEWINKK
jgi:hypothetical protein